MHCPWTRKTRAWGYDVIRGIDDDDPARLIRAFEHPTELKFVDLNSKVEQDYGGYSWTEWMHEYFGDTALHLAIKWKRHRAVKALLSLRPDWTIRNEAGDTAADIALKLYGRDIISLKDEQEREYEIDAMIIEDETMRSLMLTEKMVREQAKQALLNQIYRMRTLGVQAEALILLEHGRVLAPEAVADRQRATLTATSIARRWTSHICRELRRNRFSVQRREMRRNLLPTSAPGSRSPSPRRPLANVNISRSPDGLGVGGTRSPGRRRVTTVRTPGQDRRGKSDGAYGNSVETPPRKTVSPRHGEPIPMSAGGRPISSIRTSPAATPKGSLISAKHGGSVETPTSFSRSSRMASVRAREVLAAGKCVHRDTPIGRLQRKMAMTKRIKLSSPELCDQHSMLPASPKRSTTTNSSEPQGSPATTCRDRGDNISGNPVKSSRSSIEPPKRIVNDSQEADSAAGEDVTWSLQREISVRKCVSSREHAGEDIMSSEKGKRSDESLLGSGGASLGVLETLSFCSPPRSAIRRPSTPLSPGQRSTRYASTTYSSSPMNKAKLENSPPASYPLAAAAATFSSSPPEPFCPMSPTKEASERILGELPEGALKDALEVLMISTVVDSNGDRVPAPMLASISRQHTLKYCGPISALQASAFASVIAVRPGVLMHLSLAGARLGDQGVAHLATALPGIRRVDLCRNNVSDDGARHIALAIESATTRGTCLGTAVDATRKDPRVQKQPLLPVGASCVMESLSLAGNYIGDLGCDALSLAILGQQGCHPPQTLRWLSLAGNPGVSGNVRERLVREGLDLKPNPITIVV